MKPLPSAFALFAPLLAAVACAAQGPPAPSFALSLPPPPAPPAVAVDAPAPARVTPDAPFRTMPPPPRPALAIAAPELSELHLGNGLRVLLLERHDLPIVAVRVVSTGGAGDLAWAPPGVVSMMGSMLEQGTATRTALQIRDGYEALAAHHGTWVDWDWVGAEVKVTSDGLDAALALLADVVLHPNFPQEELDRLRARRLAGLAEEATSAVAMASNATAAALYGRGSPYGHAITGAPSDVSDAHSVDREEIVRVYAALFEPKTCAIVVAGDVTRDALAAKLEAAFGVWGARPGLRPPSQLPARRGAPGDAPGDRQGARLVVVDAPGAERALVRIAEVAVAEGDPDRDAVAVLNALLGATPSGRLNRSLRDTHAYAASATSRFDERHGRGSFAVSLVVKPEVAAAAIGEVLKEERRVAEGLASADELADAKDAVKQSQAGRFETVDAAVQALGELAAAHLPVGEYAALPGRIDKVTAEGVRKAARAHLHPEAAHVIVVGDRARLAGALAALRLGPPEARTPYGDLLRGGAR